MTLPALEDIAAHAASNDPIDGVIRIETAPREKATPIILDMMRSVYPHDQVFGQYCTVNDYIDCPPDELYEYLSPHPQPRGVDIQPAGFHPHRRA